MWACSVKQPSSPVHSTRKGLLAAGYHAVSHGQPSSSPGRGAGSGALLAVRSAYAGRWADIARDQSGRGLAATIVGVGDLHSFRFVAVYGPVGACLPGFTTLCQLEAEARLKPFVAEQVAEAISSRSCWLSAVI